MKSFVAFAVLLLAVVMMAEGRPQEAETPKGVEAPQGVEAPKENLKEAEAAYLAYSYAAYPGALAYSAYPYIVPPAATVLFRR